MDRLLARATGAAFLALGTGAVIAPQTFSRAFGLPTRDPVALAYVRATGARDAVLGALILASRDDAAGLRRILGFSSVLGAIDAVSVAALRGPRLQHIAHLGGFAALAVAARMMR